MVSSTHLGNDNNIINCTLQSCKSAPYQRTIPQFYRDAIVAFNKSKNVTEDFFKENIFSQNIWGNRFVNIMIKNTKTTLYFKNWVDSGIECIGHLRFVNGVLDEHFIYQNVRQKRNIFSEISRLKQALSMYKEHI